MGWFGKRKEKKTTAEQSIAHPETPDRHESPDRTEDELIPFYQAIAEQLNKIVPVEWEEIVLYGEYVAGVASACFYYRKQKDGTYLSGGKIPDAYGVDTNVYFPLFQELINRVKELKRAFTECHPQEWKTLTFYLKNDFQFRVEYAYEIEEEADIYQRQIDWVCKTLGIEPPDGYGKS